MRPASSGSSRDTIRRTRRAARCRCRTTRRRPSPPTSAGSGSGVPRNYYYDTVTEEVKALLDGSLRELEGLGAEIVEVTVPHHDHIAHLQHIVQTSEAATLHADWLSDRPGDYGPPGPGPDPARPRDAGHLVPPGAPPPAAHRRRLRGAGVRGLRCPAPPGVPDPDPDHRGDRRRGVARVHPGSSPASCAARFPSASSPARPS